MGGAEGVRFGEAHILYLYLSKNRGTLRSSPRCSLVQKRDRGELHCARIVNRIQAEPLFGRHALAQSASWANCSGVGNFSQL